MHERSTGESPKNMGKYKISGGESFSKPKAKTIKEKLIDLTPKRFKTYL